MSQKLLPVPWRKFVRGFLQQVFTVTRITTTTKCYSKRTFSRNARRKKETAQSQKRLHPRYLGERERRGGHELCSRERLGASGKVLAAAQPLHAPEPEDWCTADPRRGSLSSLRRARPRPRQTPIRTMKKPAHRLCSRDLKLLLRSLKCASRTADTKRSGRACLRSLAGRRLRCADADPPSAAAHTHAPAARLQHGPSARGAAPGLGPRGPAAHRSGALLEGASPVSVRPPPRALGSAQRAGGRQRRRMRTRGKCRCTCTCAHDICIRGIVHTAYVYTAYV